MKSNIMNRKGLLAVIVALSLVSAFAVVTVHTDGTDAATLEPDTSWYDGQGTQYGVGTAAELAGLAQLVNSGDTFQGVTVSLESDIDLSGYEWVPIGDGVRSDSSFTGPSFAGTFDGAGHTMSGLTVTVATAADGGVGLFGIVAGGTVENVVLTGVSVNVPVSGLAGAVAGMLCQDGTVSGCTVGTSTDGSAVTGAKGIGGVVGRIVLSGTVSDCVNNAAVTASTYNVGGIAGAVYYTAPGDTMTVSGCTNNGAVSGPTGVGGIVGLSTGDITGCTNTGTVTCTGYSAGGIAGEQKTAGSITGCTNTGSVSITTGTGYGAGGIAGWVRYDNSTGYSFFEAIDISGNSNSAAVRGGNDAGGIVGTLYNYGSVTGNTNTAPALAATNFAGGIVGNYQSVGTQIPSLTPSSGYWATVTDNASSTAVADITAANTGQFAYNNDAERCLVEGNGTAMVASVGGTGYTTLQAAVDAAGRGTVTLLADVTLTAPVQITGTVTIDGGGHTVTVSSGDRAFNVRGLPDGAVVSISDMAIDASSAERGISLYGNGSVSLVLSDVDVTADHYALNIAGQNGAVTVRVTGGTVTGYCAFQTWSDNTGATFTGTVLRGVNQWTDSSENSFATIVVNQDVTGAVITLDGCTVSATEVPTTDPAAEYVFATDAGSSAWFVLANRTTVTPWTSSAGTVPAFALSPGSAVVDDGTTTVKGYSNIQTAVGAVAKATVTGGTAYYTEVPTAFADGNTTVTLVADLVSQEPVDIPGTLSVPAGISIDATLESDGSANSAVLDGVTAGNGGFTVSRGSLVIDGDVVNGTSTGTDAVTVSGDVRISGTLDVRVVVDPAASSTTTITVPAGSSLSIGSNGSISLGTGSKLVAVGTVSGAKGSIGVSQGVDASTVTVNGSDTTALKGIVSAGVQVTAQPPAQTDTTDLDELQAMFDDNLAVEITSDITVGGGQTLTIPSTVRVTLSGSITVTSSADSTGTLAVDGATIIAGSPTAAIVIDGGYLSVDSADVRVPVLAVEGSGAYIDVTGSRSMTVGGYATADLGVGYGNTLVLTDLTVPSGMSVDVYGTVDVQGDVEVLEGAEFNVHAGGSAQISGTLTVNGTATVIGDVDVTGKLVVTDDDGGASLTMTAGTYGGTTEVDVAPTVTVTGEMDVSAGGDRGATANTLAVEGGALVVKGTLDITGTLVGNVQDRGTVLFDGTAGTGATITVYKGTNLTVESVTGTLTVTDAVDPRGLGTVDRVSGSNTVTMTDVGGLTVSPATAVTVSDGLRYHALTTTLSGTVTATGNTGGSVTVANRATAGWGTGVTDCSVVIGDLTVGRNTSVTLATADAVVDGTLTVSASGSSLAFTGSAVTVEGTIVSSDAASTGPVLNIDAKVDAVRYTVTASDRSVTTYYTDLAGALAATTDDGELTVLGTVAVDSDTTVPSGTTLDLGTGTMTVASDAVLTVAQGGLLDGDRGVLTIDGKLVVTDASTGFDRPRTLNYQVYTIQDGTATYSGLAVALADASAGDGIQLVGTGGTLAASAVIPEGVTLTVPRGAVLTVGTPGSTSTLTVDGQLVVYGTVAEAPGADVTMVVDGSVVTYDGSSVNMSADGSTGFAATGYLTFTTRIDGRIANVASGLAYASQNATDGNVTVVGDVRGDSAAFTQSEDGVLTITVPAGSTLRVGTLALTGAGSSMVLNGTFTGTVATAAGSVTMNKVSGTTVAVGQTDQVDGTVATTTLSGTVGGAMTIASGTVTVGTLAIGATSSDSVAVATGATLLVPRSGNLTVPSVQDRTALAVDGTMTVNGRVAVQGDMSVTGTLDVTDTDGFTVAAGAELTVTGTMTVGSTDGRVRAANVNGVLVIGTAPTLGAVATVSGPVALAPSGDSMAIAYAGTDVTGAVFDPVRGVQSAVATRVDVNGTPFMTVYTDQSNRDVAVSDLVQYMGVTGYQAPSKWTSGGEAVAATAPVSGITALDAVMEPGYVSDVVISAGVGLQLYVDGIVATDGMDLAYGTHTVSFAVLAGYSGDRAVITVNGTTVANGGSFTVGTDTGSVRIIASGAEPVNSTPVIKYESGDSELTEILLVVLVVVAIIMVVIAGRWMLRS